MGEREITVRFSLNALDSVKKDLKSLLSGLYHGEMGYVK